MKNKIKPKKNPNEVKINNLSNKGFKVMVLMMHAKLSKEKCSENFNRFRKCFFKNQSRNRTTEMRNTLKRVNSRLSDTEKCISDLEDRMTEMTQSE